MKKLLIYAAAGIAASVLLTLISYKTLLFEPLARVVYDSMFYFREITPKEIARGEKNRYASSRVRLAAIDNRSIDELGKWPWHRGVHAGFIQHLEKYSANMLFFDILFSNEQEVPDFIMEKMKEDRELEKMVVRYYTEPDRMFARELKENETVLIAAQLSGRDLKESSVLKKALDTEKQLQKFTREGPNVQDSPFFQPIPLSPLFTGGADPVVVNQIPDNDNVVRSVPLLLPYRTGEGKKAHIYSAVLVFALHYYRAAPRDVVIEKGSIVIKNAKVPELDSKNRQEKKRSTGFDDFEARIVNLSGMEMVSEQNAIVESYNSLTFNKDLYHFLVNEYAFFNPGDDEKKPLFPVHVLKKADGYEIIDGYEVFKAAQTLGSSRIDFILYEEQDVVIPAGINDARMDYTFLVNYSGRESIFYKSVFSYQMEEYNPVPMISYSDILTGDLPPLKPLTKPGAGDSGKSKEVLTPGQLADYEKWFVRYCEKKKNLLFERLAEPLRNAPPRSIISVIYEKQFPYWEYVLFHLAGEGIQKEDPDEYKKYLAKDFSQKVLYVNDYINNVLGEKEQEYRLVPGLILLALHEEYGKYFSFFCNNYILAGYHSQGIAYDIKKTPYNEMFGVSILANAFNTIITGNFIKRASWRLTLFAAILLALLFSLVYGKLTIWISGLLFPVILVLLYGAGYYLFAAHNILENSALFLVLNAVVFLVVLVIKLFTEEKDKYFLKSMFSQYLSPQVIDIMYRNRERPKLGGEARVITAFFSDIESFTALSESLTPEMLVQFLNEYLTAMTDIIADYHGTLDKYIGDGIVAFFGSPHQLQDSTLRSVLAALEMQDKLVDLRKQWEKAGYEWAPTVKNMRMRVGMNTDKIVTGNIGSQMRMNYTMIGDGVNLAARLESAAKSYGIYILISEFTYNFSFVNNMEKTVSLEHYVAVRYIDKIVVKGKRQPVAIYEPLCLKENLDEKTETLIKLFNEGIALYLQMEWDNAAACFEKSLEYEEAPGQFNPSRVYIDRCAEYKKHPPVKPGEEWDGVYVFKHK